MNKEETTFQISPKIKTANNKSFLISIPVRLEVIPFNRRCIDKDNCFNSNREKTKYKELPKINERTIIKNWWEEQGL